LNALESSASTLRHREQTRCALAAADAHGHDHELGAATPVFDERVAGQARSWLLTGGLSNPNTATPFVMSKLSLLMRR
jgi:hypothetical protein